MEGGRNETEEAKEPAEVVLGILQLYFMPVILCLGTLGNSLSVFVFFSTKLRNLSSSYYLSALAVSDTGFLLTSFIVWLNLVDISLFNHPGSCELSVYFTQVTSFLSVWFIVAFTVERFIAVRYPLRRPSMCTVARAKAVLIGLTALALLLNCPYLWIAGIQLHKHGNDTYVKVCDMVREQKDLATALNHMDFVITLIIPFCVIVALNTLISRTVWRVARVRRSMTKTSHAAPRKNSTRRAASSQTKVTEMLLVVSTVFICLNLPSYVMRVWIFVHTLNSPETVETEKRSENQTTIILQQYSNLLFTTNFGINFVLYCVSGQNFRRALFSLFCPRLVRRRQDTTQVTVVSENWRNASTRRAMAVNGSWRDVHEMMPIYSGQRQCSPNAA